MGKIKRLNISERLVHVNYHEYIKFVLSKKKKDKITKGFNIKFTCDILKGWS